MPSFFLAFIAVLLTCAGSRDQMLIAQLSGRLGRRVSLLAVGCLVSVLTALAMGWAGQAIAQILPGSSKTMLVAIALLLAAIELAWPNKERRAKEPTRSLFAIGLVLVSRQLGDAPRFLVFAVAASTGAPLLAGAGGALGGIAAMVLGWFLQDRLSSEVPLRSIRRMLAVLVLIAALVIGLSARGLL